MQQYLDLLNKVLTEGVLKDDRTGTGTRSIFGHQMRFDLREGFPLLTTKFVSFKNIMWELLWFLDGNTNTHFLKEHNVGIWDNWATENGDLGPIYGKQWRSWEAPNGETIDQIQQALWLLKNNPNSRRIVVTAWNPADLPDESISPQANVEMGKMSLAACHCFFQFYVANRKLSCHMYQRSCDTFLGLPYNIASYALLTHMFAAQAGLQVGDFVWSGGDIHLYDDHVEQAKLQLQRTPKKLPLLLLKPAANITDYWEDNFVLTDYNFDPAIKANRSV
jgi:thymidylate synthase